MRIVLKSERLPYRFIADHLESYVRVVSKLPECEPISHLRNMMVHDLLDGDLKDERENLRAEIEKYIDDVDCELLYDAPDFKEALKR